MKIEVTLPQDVKILQRELSRLREENEKLGASVENRDTAFRMAFEAAHDFRKTRDKFRAALQKIKDTAEDNLIAAIADDALNPQSIVLSGKDGGG